VTPSRPRRSFEGWEAFLTVARNEHFSLTLCSPRTTGGLTRLFLTGRILRIVSFSHMISANAFRKAFSWEGPSEMGSKKPFKYEFLTPVR